MHERFGTRILSFVHQIKEKKIKTAINNLNAVNLYIVITSLCFFFFDSWSFGVVLWEMATLGKRIMLRFILIMLKIKLIDKWTKIFHSLQLLSTIKMMLKC